MISIFKLAAAVAFGVVSGSATVYEGSSCYEVRQPLCTVAHVVGGESTLISLFSVVAYMLPSAQDHGACFGSCSINGSASAVHHCVRIGWHCGCAVKPSGCFDVRARPV